MNNPYVLFSASSKVSSAGPDLEKGPDKQPDKQWFQDQLARKDMTQKQAAEAAGVDPAQLSYAVNGGRGLNLKLAVNLSRVLEVPVAEVITRWGFSVPLDIPQAPVKCYALDDCSVELAAQPFASVKAPPELPFGAFAVQVRSLSVPNSMWAGMLAFVAQGQYDPSRLFGSIVLAMTTDERSLFGVLSPGYNTGTYNITSLTTPTQATNVELVEALPAGWLKCR